MPCAVRLGSWNFGNDQSVIYRVATDTVQRTNTFHIISVDWFYTYKTDLTRLHDIDSNSLPYLYSLATD